MILRAATMADAERLLEWRNDPETRAASRHTEVITPAEHRAWLERILDSAAERLYIAEEGAPVGTGRVSHHYGETEVSLTIAPEWRGKGLASELLNHISYAGWPGDVVAQIAVENIRSQRVFIRQRFLPDRCVTEHGRVWLWFRR